MINWGDIPLNTVIPFPFDSFGTNGESLTLTGLAVTDVEVYKGTSMTQRASDNGFALMDTDGIDIDTRTGIHGFSIDTSDNSDSGFYAAGEMYWVIVDAVTINTQTVRFVVGTFRLTPATSSAGVPKVDVTHFGGSAGTFSGGRPEVNTTHAAGTAWNSGAIGAPTLASDTITAAKIASDAITAAKIADGAIDAATFAAGAINNAAVSFDGSELTAIPWNASWDAEVQSEVDDALVAQRLDELLNADSDIDGAAPPTTGSVFFELLTKTTNSFTYDQTTDSLEAIRDKETDIETDTQDIQSRLPAALVSGRIDASVGAMAANVMTAAAAAADLTTELQSGLATQASVDTIDNFLDTEIAAILAAVDTEVASILSLLDDPRGEPGQGAPPVNPDLATKIDYLYKAWRNKKTQTSSTYSLFNDDASTVDQKATVSDDGTTTTVGEVASGP